MSSRRQRRRRRTARPGTRVAALASGALVLALALALTGAVSAIALVSTWLKNLPDYESPDAFKVAQATKIYSADGKLLARLYLEDRTVVPISEISTDLVDAIVAVEDERFYQHRGVDIYGIARAAIKDIVVGSFDEGASTITQQYIDNTVLRDERTDRTLRYKVREAYLAWQLEKRRSKEEILELYLNAIYFGEGAHGAQAAARIYFAKSAKDLTLGEAALLAGLPQAPSALDPYDNPEGALERRKQVLRRMLSNGYITAEELESAEAEPLELKRDEEPEGGIYAAPYFVAHVKKLLQQEFSQSLVFQGGLTVHTTLDTRLQGLAEDAVFSSLNRTGDPDSALVSIDPRDGAIKAMVGGRDYATNKFNLATQGKRQPGSSFKTFVLVTALEEGMPPYRRVNSSSPARIPSSPPWDVSNSEGKGRGYITMEAATRSSVNTVFARLIWDLNDKEKTGAEKVAAMAKRMGIASKIPPYPSIALGSQNVSPLEMASAYGTLATNGVHFRPTAIAKVVDPSGEVVFEAKPKGDQAIEPEIAYAATSILKGVISGGTATRARIGRPAAGKTGTSQNYRDAWFVGYTPQLVTSVWVGYYETETPMRNVHGSRGFGGTLAAPIWATFMKAALEGEPELDFPKQDKPEYKWRSDWAGARIAVPSIAGMTLEAAKAALDEAALVAAVVEEYSSTVPKGGIIGSNPPAGTKVDENSTVTIIVSKGPAAPVQPKPTPEPTTSPEPTATP